MLIYLYSIYFLYNNIYLFLPVSVFALRTLLLCHFLVFAFRKPSTICKENKLTESKEKKKRKTKQIISQSDGDGDGDGYEDGREQYTLFASGDNAPKRVTLARRCELYVDP